MLSIELKQFESISQKRKLQIEFYRLHAKSSMVSVGDEDFRGMSKMQSFVAIISGF